jgi:catechol 2,3-dioxygenase-like lactoylglutathione lyase family enzyme
MPASYILLYVDDVKRSRLFYADLLGQEPVEDSDTFALWVLASGLRLGLWDRAGVVPAATAGGGFEIGFPVDSDDAVDRCARDWMARGVPVIQAPGDADFGRTFTAVDPDGHRLRVMHVHG